MADALALSVSTHPNYAYVGPLVCTQFEGVLIYTPPSPTAQQRYLSQLIVTDPALFLTNYHSLLCPEQLALFNECGDAAVQKLLQLHSEQARALRERNRRFMRLQELIGEGDFFSEEAVETRDPELYREFVGRYRDVNEKAEVPNSLSEALLLLADRTERLKRCPDVKETIEADELADNEDFLLRTMHEKYIAVPDAAVDADEKYDDLMTMNRDAEEKWFEADSAPTVPGPSDTGEQDF